MVREKIQNARHDRKVPRVLVCRKSQDQRVAVQCNLRKQTARYAVRERTHYALRAKRSRNTARCADWLDELCLPVRKLRLNQ